MYHENAFDSIEFTSLFKCIGKPRSLSDLHHPHIRPIKGATSTLKLHRDSDKIKLERGASFTSCLQDAIISRFDWEERGLNIDGEDFSHLIFADTIILMAKSYTYAH